MKLWGVSQREVLEIRYRHLKHVCEMIINIET